MLYQFNNERIIYLQHIENRTNLNEGALTANDDLTEEEVFVVFFDVGSRVFKTEQNLKNHISPFFDIKIE